MRITVYIRIGYNPGTELSSVAEIKKRSRSGSFIICSFLRKNKPNGDSFAEDETRCVKILGKAVAVRFML